MNRDPDPPGVTYEGGDGIYHMLMGDEFIGTVIHTWQHDRECWHTIPKEDPRWGWTAPTRRQAVEGLIAWLETQP